MRSFPTLTHMAMKARRRAILGERRAASCAEP